MKESQFTESGNFNLKQFYNTVIAERDEVLLAINSDRIVCDYFTPNGKENSNFPYRSVVNLEIDQIFPSYVNALFDEAFEKLETGVSSAEFEYSKIAGDRNTWFHVILYTRHGEEQVQDGCIAVIRDISNRKADEDNIKKGRESIERSKKELQDFVYIASHDLQEPVRKIITFADILNTKYSNSLDSEGKDYLFRMQNASQRMQNLIQDLLMYSQVSTKVRPFQVVDLNEVLQNVFSDLEVTMNETGAEIEIEELPLVIGDRVQMNQLFQNILSNAIKFRKNGIDPRVHVSYQGVVNSLNQIIISDNGIGFDMRFIEKIFAPFQRLHGQTEYPGSGIGLSICKKIVERHNGHIKASSEIGRGSQFTISLPVM